MALDIRVCILCKASLLGPPHELQFIRRRVASPCRKYLARDTHDPGENCERKKATERKTLSRLINDYRETCLGLLRARSQPLFRPRCYTHVSFAVYTYVPLHTGLHILLVTTV